MIKKRVTMKNRNPKNKHPQNKVGKKHLQKHHPKEEHHQRAKLHQLPTLGVDLDQEWVRNHLMHLKKIH